MKAIRYYRYGAPDVLELRDVDLPAVHDDDVLVRIRAASINPLDWHFMRGKPYVARAMAGLSRPKAPGLGVDLAGTVEAVGRNVTTFRPGDEVFGGHTGTLAEYVSVPEDKVLLTKPANLTFEQAAAVPVAAFTALQALRDKGLIRLGHAVLVNGAAGGVGTFTVQLAKAFGADVTGVCGPGHVDLVRSIGADRVIDYTREDFTQIQRRHDLMVDVAGNRPLRQCRRVLTPTGTLVLVGGPNKGQWVGPLTRAAKMILLSAVVRQRMVPFLAHQSREDLTVLRDLLEDGKVTPVIDRTYPLTETAEAIRYLEEGHASGKVVITM